MLAYFDHAANRIIEASWPGPYRVDYPASPDPKLCFRIDTTSLSFSIRISQTLINGFCAFSLVLACCSSSQAGIFGGAKPVPGPTVDGNAIKPLSFGQFKEYFTLYTVDILDPKSGTYKTFVADRDRLRALASAAR